MARNKYPEETVARILDASLALFLEKGYENTTIQDIIDHLGGLSKGAIYHHFKSKEEILEAVCDQRLFGDMEAKMAAIRDEAGLTGREKLRKMFRVTLQNPRQEKFMTAAPRLMHAPRMMIAQLESQINDVGPHYVLPVLREGVADGSIRTAYPEACAQVLLLFSNVWLNPLVYPETQEEAARKYEAANRMLQSIGLDLLDDEVLLERYLLFHARVNAQA